MCNNSKCKCKNCKCGDECTCDEVNPCGLECK